MAQNKVETEYNVGTEFAKIIAFRDKVVEQLSTHNWDSQSYDEINKFSLEAPKITPEDELLFRHFDGGCSRVSGIKNLPSQELARRFRRWKIEKKVTEKGIARKKFQDLNKSLSGKYNYLGSPLYIEPSSVSKLPEGWEEFAAEEETSTVFESRLLAAQACLVEATVVTQQKNLFNDNVSEFLKESRHLFDTKYKEDNNNNKNNNTQSGAPEILNDKEGENPNTEAELLRSKLKKRIDELRKEKQMKEEQEKGTYLKQLEAEIEEDNDDQYEPELPNPIAAKAKKEAEKGFNNDKTMDQTTNTSIFQEPKPSNLPPPPKSAPPPPPPPASLNLGKRPFLKSKKGNNMNNNYKNFQQHYNNPTNNYAQSQLAPFPNSQMIQNYQQQQQPGVNLPNGGGGTVSQGFQNLNPNLNPNQYQFEYQNHQNSQNIQGVNTNPYYPQVPQIPQMLPSYSQPPDFIGYPGLNGQSTSRGSDPYNDQASSDDVGFHY